MLYFFIYIVVAYLIGSIPTAIWYGRIFHKTDIRQHGSGNAGATNMMRTFGKKAGIIVLIIDILKGILGVHLAPVVCLILWGNGILTDDSTDYGHPVEWMYYAPLAWGLAAGLGHIYPIYEKFKGGKAVATLFGVILAINPYLTLYAVGTFMLMFIITRRVSVGSIFSSVAFAVAFIISCHTKMMTVDYIFLGLYPVLIMYTHRSNIKRLLNGTEPKLSLGKKKDGSNPSS